MELLLKLGITAIIVVLVYYQVLFLRFVWRSQIDVRETVSRFARRFSPESDVLAVRDPNAIYQGGVKVGDVTGAVETTGDVTIFRQLSETSSLKRDQPFEYRRDRFVITKVGGMYGSKSVVSGFGPSFAKAVLENVECKRLP